MEANTFIDEVNTKYEGLHRAFEEQYATCRAQLPSVPARARARPMARACQHDAPPYASIRMR